MPCSDSDCVNASVDVCNRSRTHLNFDVNENPDADALSEWKIEMNRVFPVCYYIQLIIR